MQDTERERIKDALMNDNSSATSEEKLAYIYDLAVREATQLLCTADPDEPEEVTDIWQAVIDGNKDAARDCIIYFCAAAGATLIPLGKLGYVRDIVAEEIMQHTGYDPIPILKEYRLLTKDESELLKPPSTFLEMKKQKNGSIVAQLTQEAVVIKAFMEKSLKADFSGPEEALRENLITNLRSLLPQQASKTFN